MVSYSSNSPPPLDGVDVLNHSDHVSSHSGADDGVSTLLGDLVVGTEPRVTGTVPHSGRTFRTVSGHSQTIVIGLNMVGGLQVFSTFSVPFTLGTQW